MQKPDSGCATDSPLDDLVKRLRGLGVFENDDHSIGDEAADRIEELHREIGWLKGRLAVSAVTGIDRNAVIEECAKVCDALLAGYEQEAEQLRSRDFHKTAHEVHNEGRGARECADRIRDLKDCVSAITTGKDKP